jgi:predicted SprT family Zn-dependent metalloprotease
MRSRSFAAVSILGCTVSFSPLILDCTIQNGAAMATPTQQTYYALQAAYDHFNTELFKRDLPACLMTLQREGSTVLGYYSQARFKAKGAAQDAPGAFTDEIAMNPLHMDREDEDVLSTLVHEMVHLWQFHRGEPGRRGYHNKEWADKMLALGLTPINNKKPGKMTGDSMHHRINEGQAFDRAAKALIKTGWRLVWHDPHLAFDLGGGAKSKQTRQKYTCPVCGLNAWAKPEAALMCGDCRVDLVEV